VIADSTHWKKGQMLAAIIGVDVVLIISAVLMKHFAVKRHLRTMTPLQINEGSRTTNR
jgi:hypothetical protein